LGSTAPDKSSLVDSLHFLVPLAIASARVEVLPIPDWKGSDAFRARAGSLLFVFQHLPGIGYPILRCPDSADSDNPHLDTADFGLRRGRNKGTKLLEAILRRLFSFVGYL
jgi:hypothetical protein